MKMRLEWLLRFGPVILAVASSSPAGAAAFKAQFYPDCYAPVATARALVPPPPPDVAGTAKKAGEVAGVLGKLGGVPGLGGLGGLGKVASLGQQAASYSNLIADAAKFTQKMQQDYPDAAARLAAYGDKMSGDADTIGEAALKVNDAQACYENAYTALKAAVIAAEIKPADAAKRQKEIVAGLDEADEVLADARTTMDMNMKSYNEALTTDTTGMGLNLGSLAQVAGAVNAGGVTALQTRAQATGMYSAYYNQTNAYTSAWWDGYNRSGGDQAAANAAAQATLNGGASPVKGYQEAYWRAQAAAASKGAPLSAVPAAASNFGALQALSSVGGFGGLSGNGLAFLAANQAIGAVGAAATGNGESTAPAVAAAAPAVNVGQAVSTANALRGLSGGGAAFVGANLAVGAIGNAITGNGQQAETQVAAAPEVSEAMQSSLLKTSVDSSKFADAYGLVSWQSQRNTEIATAAKTNLN